MKKLKKFAGLILALVMVCAMGITALADEPTSKTYTITINNGTSGYTYTAYQVFAGDLSDDGVLSNIVWGDAIDTSTVYTKVQGITVDGDTPFKDLTTAADIAAVLSGKEDNSDIARAFAEAIKNSLITNKGKASTDSSGTYTISDLSAGYYLVETTGLPTNDNGNSGAYTRYILAVVGDATVTTKSNIPSVDKAVDQKDANIQDTVTYTLSATLPTNYADYSTYKLVFHDTMSKGLYYSGNSEVTVTVYSDATTYYATTDKSTLSGKVVSSAGYEAKAGDYSSTDGTVITFTIADTKSLTDTSGASITVTKDSLIEVTFKATLNENAIIGGEGNPNEVYLEYSNNPNSGGSGDTGFTPTDKVVTWTFELDVTKVKKNTTTVLSGAEFVLSNANGKYVKLDSNGKVNEWVDTVDEASTLISDADGNFSVIGLDEGTYYLTETKAPTGYNKMEGSVTVKIIPSYSAGDGDKTNDVLELTGLKSEVTVNSTTTEATETTDGKVGVTVENSAGTVLPTTGGIGTTIFYVIGTVLILGAAVLLVTRRRMGNME